MPQVGSVFVPDQLWMPTAAERPRPGFGEILGAAARGAYGQVRYGLPYQIGKLADTVTPVDEQFYREGLAKASIEASKAPAASVDDVLSGRVNPVRFAAENLVASLPYMVGATAGGVVGGVTGGPGGALVGAVAGGVPQFSASNVARAVEEQGGLSDAAAERAFIASPFQAFSDVAVARYLPGAGRVLGDLAATQAGGFIKRTGKAIVKAGATEAATEAGQQVAERYAAGVPLGTPDAAAEYVNAAVTAFAVGGLLGAGGGIRRTNAIAKPANLVTNEDMSEHIDAMLALPSPAQFGRPDQEGPAALPAPGPGWAGFRKAVEVPGTRQDAARPYEGLSDAELESAMGAVARAHENGSVTDELARVAPLIVQEAEVRAAGRASIETSDQLMLPSPTGAPQVTTIDTLPTPSVLVGDTRDVWSQSAVNTDQVPRERPFSEQLAAAKKGLRGGFVQSVEASTPDELLQKVYNQIFVEQDTRANTRKFAQRLGILDENMEPGPEAKRLETLQPETSDGTSVEAGPTATPMTVLNEPGQATQAVSSGFDKQWAETLKEAGVKRVASGKGVLDQTPANMEAARAAVFRALATDTTDAAKVPVSQIEKVARKLGLVTDDDAMDVTPLGRQTFLTTPEGLEASVAAAQQQGFTGVQASLFDRGAKGEAQDSFTSFEDMAAYQAGKVWAEDFVQNGDVRTAKQTKAIQERQVARPVGEAVSREAVRVQLSPQQVQQAALNRLIGVVDLKGAKDTERAALWRMVRDGASSEEVGRAVQTVQQGGTLFEQPAPQPYEAPVARVDRTSRALRALEPAVQAEVRRQRESGSKAGQRAETRDLLRHEIDAAFQSGDISPKERIGLVARLVKGDYVGVVNNLPGGPLRSEMRVSRRGFLAGVAATAVSTGFDAVQAKVAPLTRTIPAKQMETYLRGGDIVATLKHLSEHSADANYRVIARKLLEAGGWDRVTLSWDNGSAGKVVAGEGLLGETELKDGGTTEVSLYGDEGGSEETVLHELIHAFVQQRWAGVSRYTTGNEILAQADRDRHDTIVRSFQDLWAKVGIALKTTNPDLIDNESWASAFYSNPDEALAWMLTNKQAQAYLRTIDENGAKVSQDKSLWQQFLKWVGDLLGMKLIGPQETALDKLMDAGHAILDAGKDVRAGEFSTAFVKEWARQAERLEMRVSAENRTVQTANEITKGLAAMTAKATENINIADFGVKARRKLLGWISHNQIDRQYGQLMPGLLRHSDAHRERIAVRSRFEQMGDEAYQSFEKLERENAKAAEWVGQLMALTTEFQLDHEKPWEQHKHLLQDKNAAKLKAMHAQAVDVANKLKRGTGQGMKVFNEFRALNEAQNFARMAAGLHSLVAMDPELSLGIEDSMVNPVDQFMREEGLTTAQAIRDRWSDLLHKQVAGAVAFVNEKKGQAAQGTEGDQRAMREHLSPIELQVAAIHEALAGMQKAPYFHLGRFGDNFGSAVIRKNKDGTADPAAMAHVAQELEKAGFADVQISVDNTRPRFMLRFDTVDATRRFRELALRLQKEGWLSEDAVKAGPRTREDNFGVAEGLPGYVQRYIQAIEASPMFVPDETMSDKEKSALEQKKNDAVRLAVDTWLEQQPDSSISKVLVKRYTVPGYNKDMIRNFAHRWRVGSISLANVAAQPKFNRAYIDMRGQLNDALIVREDGGADPFMLSDLMSEMKTRDATSPINETADTYDKLRAFGHAYFLGMSPAYAIINLTQLGVTALPELAKKHGYSKSFHALRRASTQAYAILKAAASEAKALGPKHYADVAITESVLKKAGLSDEVRNFALHMLATGTIDIGSAARALGQIAENRVGSKTDIALKYASAFGMYTETFSRLTTALAARDLHGGSNEETAKYATKVVSNSMFDYQNWNTARQLGKQGFAGPITPLLTQFMSYSVQVTEKLYSEFMDAATRARPGESAADAKQRRAEARQFLYGHLTAVTALAGTLGMPFASVFATVIERLVDAADDDDEPYDATAAWRNFLADVLGKDAGEAVARGVPRAVGFDISQRAGEADLLPFSKLIGDRRGWREAIEGMLGRSIGASPNMLLNVAEGGEKFAEGDILGGLKAVLPVALKGPTETFRMTQDGYLDSKGNRMPMSPDASSYLWQLIGFAPAEKADYSEARGDQMARRGELSRKATRLRQQIVKAMLQGDQDTARGLIDDAVKFDQDNPAFAVVPSLAGSLQQQMLARTRAQALRSPLGVSFEDIAGQRLTDYANVQYVN